MGAMNLAMSWLDVVLMMLLAGITVMGMKRGLLGLVTGLLSLLLWLVVNAFGDLHPLVGFVLALGFGFGMAWFGRTWLSGLMQNLSDFANQAAGGVGGFVLGFCLVCTLALSFPLSDNPINRGRDYPSVSLPIWLGEAISGSAIKKWLTLPANQGGLAIWASASPLRGLFTPDIK
jgi:hypothetical protein